MADLKKHKNNLKPYRPTKNGIQSKTYYVKFRFNGKQINKSTGKTVKADAEKWIRENVNPMTQQTNIQGLTQSFKDASIKGSKIPLDISYEVFASSPEKKIIGQQSEREKQSMWADFIAYINGEHPDIKFINQLDHKICSEYLSLIVNSGRYKKSRVFNRSGKRGSLITVDIDVSKKVKLSNKTHNAFLVALKQICKSFVLSDSLLENPFDNIKALVKNPESREIFSEDELRLIGENLTDFVKPIFIIGLFTGLRKGDICTLKWSEVNLKTGWINRKLRKTKNDVRIPIQDVLHEFLSELPKSNKYVVPQLAKMYLTNITGIGYRFKSFLEGLGIQTTRKVEGRTKALSVKDIHSLRHNFVYQAAQMNTPFPVIQSIVGHMDTSMTKLYADHATDKDKEQLHTPNLLGLPEASNKANDKAKVKEIRGILNGDKFDSEKLRLIAQLLL